MSTINPKPAKSQHAALTGGIMAAIAVLGLAASPAHAQSNEEHFEGVSIGVQAGWEERSINETVLPSTINATLDDKSDGLAYAAFAAYDHQFDNIVVGVEAGFAPNGRTLNAALPGGSIELDSKWSADLTARVGVTVTPRLLAYGRAGYGINRTRISGFVDGQMGPVESESATSDGFIFGGGLEYALTGNASVRAEYRRKEFDGSLSSNQVLAGVAFRF